MSKIIKYEEVKTYIENSGYKLISNEYISAKSKLTIEDSKGYLYVISFDKIKQGRKPRFADNLNPYTIQNIRLWCRLNNKPFELVDCAYINNRTKLKWKKLNNECGEIFEMNWHNAYFGLGKRCRSNFNVNLSDSLFANCLKIALMWHPDKNGNLTPYNVICGSDKKVWWQCSYGHEWVARIRDRYKGAGCPYCSGRFPTKENNLLIKNQDICKEWNYEKNKKLPEEYCPNSSKKVWWKCKDCSYEWKATINDRTGKDKTGCSICNQSKGEKTIKEWLNKNHINYIPQKDFEGLIGVGYGKLSYDFWLINYNILIEYQGQFHDGGAGEYTKINLKKQQEHDRRKKEYAKNNNIELLEIWYWDFDKIEEILTNKILYKEW